MGPLFAIDVGNSTIGIALYEDCSEERIVQRLLLPTTLLGDGDIEVFLREFYSVFGDFIGSQKKKTHAVASSVVPTLNRPLTEVFRKLMIRRPLFINYKNNRILRFKVSTPKTIGSDRIATTAAAYLLYKRAVAVVDFGTATTLSIVDKDGIFRGGAIMPGLGSMLECLRDTTAQLPLTNIQEVRSPLGRDTISAILAGVILGTAGAVERIIGDIEKAYAFKLQLALTGGHAGHMRPYLKRPCTINPNLIYEGLRQIYLRQNI